jgi:hypothetical protein
MATSIYWMVSESLGKSSNGFGRNWMFPAHKFAYCSASARMFGFYDRSEIFIAL